MPVIFVISVVVIITILCAIGIRVHQKNTNAIYKSNKRLDGKTAIVTGGTAGMGLEVARDLARRGARVIIACPFQQEGINAKNKIIEDTGNLDVQLKLLDFASLASVNKFANDISENEHRLDILINNAGILNFDDVLTKDGINFVMQVNYFGHFLLTLLLLPLLRKTGSSSNPSRIVNTSSLLHRFGVVDIDKMNKVGFWSHERIYSNSKLCVAIFTRELSKRLAGSNVVVNSVDPGAVGTKIYDGYGKLIGTFTEILFRTLFKTPWEGAQTALYVALDDKTGEVSGEFFKNCKLSRAISTVYYNDECNKLWEESMRLVKLKDFKM